jgi:hypothetical protein
MVNPAVTMQNSLDGLTTREWRRKSPHAGRLAGKRWRYYFGVWVHESLDLVRTAGRAPGVLPDLAGVTLSKVNYVRPLY